jgi:hypothetical protein
MARSFLVQIVSLALVVLGVMARAAESSDAAMQMDRPDPIEAPPQPSPNLEPNGVPSFDGTPALEIGANW